MINSIKYNFDFKNMSRINCHMFCSNKINSDEIDMEISNEIYRHTFLISALSARDFQAADLTGRP